MNMVKLIDISNYIYNKLKIHQNFEVRYYVIENQMDLGTDSMIPFTLTTDKIKTV